MIVLSRKNRLFSNVQNIHHPSPNTSTSNSKPKMRTTVKKNGINLESMYMAKRKHMLLCARNLHSRRNECLEILMLIRIEDQEGAISNPGMGRVCEQRSRPKLTDTKEV